MTGEDWVDADVIDKLEQMVGTDVVLEIIDLFLEHAPRRLAIALEAGTTGDMDTVAGELHSLKSSAGSIGAFSLQQLAEETEKLAVDGRKKPVCERLGELSAMLDSVSKRLVEVRTGRTK